MKSAILIVALSLTGCASISNNCPGWLKPPYPGQKDDVAAAVEAAPIMARNVLGILETGDRLGCW